MTLTGIFILFYCDIKLLVTVSDDRVYDIQIVIDLSILLQNVLTDHVATN